MIGLLAFATVQAVGSWAMPTLIPVPHVEAASVDQPRRIEPIGGYTLALIWTPEHCLHPVPGAEGFQCGSNPGAGFVLHGLWPDGLGKSWPQWCADAVILPRRVIAAHFHATPSAQLMQHEWAKHGTCMGISADAYFKRSDRLFRGVRYPAIAALARAPVTAGAFTQAFAAANPGMRADMVNLNLDRDGWLREVWLCLDRRFIPERCAAPIAGDRVVRIRPPA